MAMVNRTRLRRSGTRKIFRNFSSIQKTRRMIRRRRFNHTASPPQPGRRDSRKSLPDQNGLAAGLLDLLLRGLGKLVRMHGKRNIQFAVAENLQQLAAALEKALGHERVQRKLSLVQLRQAIQVEHGVLGAEDVGKAALGQTAMQRHLAALKAAHQARTRA